VPGAIFALAGGALFGPLWGSLWNLLGATLGATLAFLLARYLAGAPAAVAFTWPGFAGREALGGEANAVRYGLLALGLLAAIAILPRLIGRLRGGAFAWIEADDLKRRLDRGEGVTIIDMRGPDEVTGSLGHFAEALNLPLGELPSRLTEINARRDKPVVVVCRTGKRSAAAAQMLRAAGRRSAYCAAEWSNGTGFAAPFDNGVGK
jgi:rhodanese-related sulfurtransferase